MAHKLHPLGSFWLLLALLLLTLPLNWVAAAILAAAVHELCHLAVLKVFRIPVSRLRISAWGARLDTGPMTEKEEILSSLAGPAGSFLLVFLLRYAPRVAICGMVQGAFNLLPVGNLDGRRVVRCAIRLIRGKSPCKRGEMKVQ